MGARRGFGWGEDIDYKDDQSGGGVVSNFGGVS